MFKQLYQSRHPRALVTPSAPTVELQRLRERAVPMCVFQSAGTYSRARVRRNHPSGMVKQ